MNLLSTLTDLYTNGTNVGLPHLVGSSMRVADVAAEMSTLTTNITFCHDSTSLPIGNPNY